MFYNIQYTKYFVLVWCSADPKLIRKKDIIKLRLVVTTESVAGLLYMMGVKSGFFSHIFVDEAGQTMEPEILLPLGMRFDV